MTLVLQLLLCGVVLVATLLVILLVAAVLMVLVNKAKLLENEADNVSITNAILARQLKEYLDESESEQEEPTYH